MEERYSIIGQSENDVSEQRGCLEVIRLENEVVVKLKKLMDTEELSECRLQETVELLESYYYEVLRDGFSIGRDYGIESIRRLLTFLLSYPVKKNINKSYIEKVYDRLNLINISSYILTQNCKTIINSKLIKDYMNHIKGTIIEARSAFCLYRVNSDYIRNLFGFYSLDNLSPKDLYYGITTGYYEMSVGKTDSLGRQAIHRLGELCADNELNRLKKDGFLIELYI